MKTNVAIIKNLSHRYSKDWAVKNISFEIPNKGILGLLGSNGAGKSTTMNIMCGVINQTRGDVIIDGINIRENPVEAKKLIGFLPQKAPLHMELTVDEYLTHCAYMRSMDSKDIPKALEIAKEKCGITHFSTRVLRNLSGGYQQRVGIAQAIIHTPKLVVLDEPTNGLDPVQILEVRKLIRQIAEDHSVILSTHIMSEVQATCKEIIMIEKGHVVFADTIEAFNNYVVPSTLIIEVEKPPSEEVLKAIKGVDNVYFITAEKIRLQFDDEPGISKKIIIEAEKNDWGLSEIYYEKSSLDDIFAYLSGKKQK